jgi:hypothetical protein
MASSDAVWHVFEGHLTMSLVNELQDSAENDDVVNVLRKAKRLASKLDRQDIAEWLEAEQSGYASGQDVPEYRMVATRLAYNTNGLIPAGYGRLMNGVQQLPASYLDIPIPVIDSISTVLTWIEQFVDIVSFPIPEGTEVSRAIRRTFRFPPMVADQITFLYHLNGSQIKAIPERIKDKVLDWALALERAGVTGEGISFSKEEKRIADSVTFNITGSTIGQLTNSGINRRIGK